MKTILIVDDTYENLYFLKVILEGAGYLVIEANDGNEGLDKLQHNYSNGINVDLIISDILMPVMDGYMFCQECKKNQLFYDIPFVFYTSTYTEKLDEDFALKLGALHFLRKPTDQEKILKVIHDIFNEVSPKSEALEKLQFTEQEVLKLYSERLISKLEQKKIDLEKEVIERKKAEQLLIHKNEILDLIAINTPIHEIFNRLLLNYETVHPNYFGSLSLLNEDGIHLNLVSAPSMPKSYNLAMRSVEIGEFVGSCGTAAYTKKPVIVSDISTNKLWADFKDIAISNNLKSCWSLPILSENNEVLGTFAIYSNSINTPSLEDIRELKLTLSLINIVIEKSNIVAEIKKKDESYKALVNQASDAIITYTLDGIIHSFNKATYQLLGYTLKEFSKLRINDFLVGDFVSNPNLFDRIVKGDSVLFERQMICKNKTILDIEITAKKQTDGKVLSIARNITDRKQSEIKLKESEYNLRQSQIVASIGSYTIDLNSGAWGSSIVLNKIFGINESFVKSEESWKVIIHPDHLEETVEHFKSAIHNRRKIDIELKIIKLDSKKEVWVHTLGDLVYDSDGNPIKIIGTTQDINQRKNNELELKVANEFSSSLLKSMNEGLYAINLDSEIISVNPAFCKMTGFTEKELIGTKRPYPFSPPELKDENNERYNLLIQDKNKTDYENIYVRKNGDRFPVHVLVSSIHDENGIKTANFATIEDITERRKAERNLQLAKEFNDNLVMSMQEGLIIVNLDGQIMLLNNSACAMLGYTKDELIGLNLPYPFTKKEDVEKIKELNIKIAKGEAPKFQFEFIRKNGELFIVSFLTGTIKNEDGEIIALFGTIKDVTEEEKAKNVLELSAKRSLERKNVIIELASLVGTDYKEALNKITALSAKILNVDRGGILKFNEEKTEMLCEKLYHRKKDDYESGQVFCKKGNEKFFDKLINNEMVAASDAITHEFLEGFVDDHLIPLNIKSKLSIPIQGVNEVYGILCFEQVDTVHVWSTDEEEFATSIANLVSLMIQSSERRLAEKASILANSQLTLANIELNKLRNQLEQENVYLRNELDLVFNYEEMVYGSAEFSNVLTEIEKVAPTSATVLLLGESGTGKELLARAIHNTSARNKKPLIKVNCSAIPRELLESELFGHKKGSFTGAFNDKIGKFELADQGTLFLDEIGELPIDMQPKILRFLQEGEIEVVGGTGTKKLDVRVIAATNRNLKEEIKNKRFREDLYFRLHVFPINVPALRERKDDIPLLVEHFVDKFNKEYGKNIKYIADEAMRKLKNYNWPGNIRELENLIERASILSTEETLSIPGFESSGQMKNSITNKDLSLDAAQRNHIELVLEQCDWKISGPNGASKLLDIKPSTLRDRMKKLDLNKPQ